MSSDIVRMKLFRYIDKKKKSQMKSIMYGVVGFGIMESVNSEMAEFFADIGNIIDFGQWILVFGRYPI